MRVYVPSTLTALRDIVDRREVAPAPLGVFAVTPALREWYVGGDAEELEYAAMTLAARASLRLIAADGSRPCRVVLAADLDAVRASAAGGPTSEIGAAVADAPIPWRAVASIHVDDPDATDDVRAALAALAAAEAGDDDAQFVVDAVEDHELQWFATQEVAALLDRA